MNGVTIWMIVASTVALITGFYSLIYASRRAREDLRARNELRSRIDQLENELSALMDGSFGMGSHLEALSRDLKGAIDRQHQLEQRDLGDLPYNEAVRLVAQGAKAHELMRHCGLSRSEADLVLLLHNASPPVVSPSSMPEEEDNPFHENISPQEKRAPFN